MKEVTEVKDMINIDKDIERITKDGNKSFIPFVTGVAYSSAVGALISVAKNGLSIADDLKGLGVLLGSAVVLSAPYFSVQSIREVMSERKIARLANHINAETGVELELEDLKKAIITTEEKTSTMSDKDGINNSVESEIIKRIHLLDKKGQIQVLQYTKKTIKDNSGVNNTHQLFVYDEEDKRNIDYLDTDKRLMFVPKLSK